MNHKSLSVFKMKLAVLLQLGLCVIVSCVAAQEYVPYPSTDYCYSEDVQRPQNVRMNTKTAYQLVKGGSTDLVNVPPGCTPSKFWILSRHGTRLPTAKHIEKMKKLPQFQSEILENNGKGKGGLCVADVNLFRTWQLDSNITEDIGDWLTVQG